MARVLHVVSRGDAPLVANALRHDVAAGDEVTVALLAAAGDGPPLPEGVAVHRVPSEWSYDELLEGIFAADRVVTW